MKAHKFKVKIQENGIIQIPEMSAFAHQEAEIFLLLEPQVETEVDKVAKVEAFLAKRSGILGDADMKDVEAAKSAYLQEKYR